MDDKTYRLSGAGALTVPAAHVDKLLELGDGECALLYLHALRMGGTLSPALAARELGRSEERILAAAEKLGRAGLWSTETPPLPGPPDTLTGYSSGEIVRRTRDDRAFQGLLSETQRVLGHSLSGEDLKTLFGIYDQLAMSPEVIMLLINHCAERRRRRYGEGRLPTMSAIRKEAFRWANREILTLEQAEEYVASLDRMEEESRRVRAALGLADRQLAPTERSYLENWLSMGYGADALAVAYDRTVVSTGKLTWAYMDKIVKSWYRKGLFTPEEIEKGDVRPGGRRPETKEGSPETPGGDDKNRLKRILNMDEVK